MKRLAFLLLPCSLLALLPATARAQVDTGSILGTIHDSSGAPIPSATVTVTEMKTNASTLVTSNSSGDYIVTPLRIGTYEVSVDMAGFKKETRSNITLRVQDRLRIDF